MTKERFRKVEFVGGPKDGETMIVRADSDVIRIPKQHSPPIVWPPKYTLPQPIQFFVYLVSFDGKSKKWFARLSG